MANTKPSIKRDPGFSIRLLNEADLAALSALADKIWRVTYPQILAPKVLEHAIKEGYSPAKLKLSLQGAHRLYGLFLGSKMAGFSSTELKPDGSVFIHKLYVDNDLHGAGYGLALLEHVEGTYPGATLRLNVNRQNIKAINFYFRQGFVIEKLDPHDNDVGFFADDFLMVKKK